MLDLLLMRRWAIACLIFFAAVLGRSGDLVCAIVTEDWAVDRFVQRLRFGGFRGLSSSPRVGMRESSPIPSVLEVRGEDILRGEDAVYRYSVATQ